jgi:hypothetical protein
VCDSFEMISLPLLAVAFRSCSHQDFFFLDTMAHTMSLTHTAMIQTNARRCSLPVSSSADE